MLNTHNPADTHGNAGRWRAESVRRELKRIHQLRSNGATVLFTGDMNAKQDFFCRATRSGMLHSASGGSSGKKCRYPSANGIDWVLGTRDVRFSALAGRQDDAQPRGLRPPDRGREGHAAPLTRDRLSQATGCQSGL